MDFDRSLEPRYGEAVRLSARVLRLLARNPGPFTFLGTGVHIVGEGGAVAVIDPGPDDPAHLAALKAAIGARRVSHILVTHTHKDHSPAAAPLKAWSGAPTHGFGPHVQTDDVEEGGDRLFMPDVRVKDGDSITGEGFTLECVHTPGHTSNHICYALAEEKALFSGDHVMGWSTSVIAPPDGDMGAYLASLEKLLRRDDAIYYPTHGSPIAQPKDHVRALIAHRRQRAAQVRDAMARGVDTVPALVAELYADVAPALHKAAALTVQAHLEQMLRAGEVVQSAGRYRLND
jgi:glyoxylase-like metal-dependent hydrolase (beta-lactamase superfamily II)